MAQTLEFKPDFEDAKNRWLAFWNQEIIDRPVCSVRAPKGGAQPKPWPGYLVGAREDFGPLITQILEAAEATWWGGDAMPCYTPSFGPDQMAAWLGADLKFDERGYGTNWAIPCVQDWHDWLPLKLDPKNPWWTRFLAFMREMAAAFRGKLLLTHVDLHSNADLLSAMRLPQRVCLDMYDVPELMDRVMADAQALYPVIYDAIYEAGNMGEWGTLGWVPAYHPVKTNTIQCDFAALIGPKQFKRWVLPALAEEAAHLGHCVYHYDGPECLVHLADLCSIPGLDCIQWTTGARNRPFHEWMDLLKDMQSRGMSLWIPCSTEDIKLYHKELKPNMLFYDCWAPTQEAGEETLRWLEENT